MSQWLYPANTKLYDVFAAFAETETYWPISSRVEAGDIVYFYLAAPYKQIGFRARVIDTGHDASAILEAVRPFIKTTPDDGKAGKPFMRIAPDRSCELDKDGPLALPALREHGLGGMLMGPRKLDNNPELLAYLQETCA